MKLFTAKRARADAEAEAEAEYSQRLADVSDELDRRYALIDLSDAADRLRSLRAVGEVSRLSQRTLVSRGVRH